MSSFDTMSPATAAADGPHREVDDPRRAAPSAKPNGQPGRRLLWPPGCPSTTSPCGPPASQRSKRHSGQVVEQLVDPALLRHQRDRRA